MERRTVDVAVIGAGTAGLSARRAAAKAGATVVMVEGGPYGTTCARVGCMPSKLLIAAADVAHEVGRAGRFGIEVDGSWRVDGRRVLDRVRRERDRFVGFVIESTEAIPAAQRLRGRARFLGPTTLEVDGGVRVEARAVVIATGSRPRIPPSLDTVRERVLVSDDVFDLADLPRSVAVVGTGVIGLELGQALHRLGVRTVFFSHSDRLGPVTDPEVRRSVAACLGDELALNLCVEIEASPAPDGGVAIRWRDEAGTVREERVERVLAAAGRVPNVDELGLERTGVELDGRGVPVFDHRTMQCGDRPIFLAGDVAVDRPLLHEAADEGRIAGLNAARCPDVRAEPRRTPLAIVFTDPQMAVVGTGFEALDQAGVEIGAVDYGDQGRARVIGRDAGCVRVYGDRERCTVVGAEMFGPRVEHTAHLLSWAVQAGLGVGEALQMPFYHPVVEEGVRTALRDLSARLKTAAAPCALDLECGPGT
jgi:dihydrolipoamide dehydrogenase